MSGDTQHPKPARLLLSRQRGFNLQAESVRINGLSAVKVDRATRWGNPFNDTQSYVAFPNFRYQIPLLALRTKPSLDRCIDMFVAYARGRLEGGSGWLEPLRGKNLACWCALGAPCHADHLLRLANELARAE